MATTVTRRPRRSSLATTGEIRFDQRLVLVQWMFSLFGASGLEDLTGEGNWDEYEGFTDDGQTVFLPLVANRKANHASISKDILTEYDANIVRHWKEIAEQRQEQGRRPTPKYFQYLALLFTEIYLDHFFADSEKLRAELNAVLVAFNTGRGSSEPLPPYEPDELRKLAFWSATGSGKTLLMHVNIKQYRYYLKKYGRERELNKVILLTPNERLSEQHRDEFEKSNIMGELFNRDAASLFQEDRVEIIDIHKLKDE